MEIPYTLIIDLARPLKSNTILISEGDARSRRLYIVLMNNGKKLDMKDVQTVTIKGVKADDTILFGDCTIVTDAEGQPTNTVTYVLPSALADLPGRTTYTLTLNSETAELITTPEFYTQTNRQLYDEDDYLSESDLSGFRDYMNRSLAAATAAEHAKAQAQTSETAAGVSASHAQASETAAKQYEELIEEQIRNHIKGPVGPQGEKGETGPAGADGKTPAFSINSAGHLIATFE